MNFSIRHRKTESSLLKQQSYSFSYSQQLTFLFETLEFVLVKLRELCGWQKEQEGLKRKRSTVKYFNGNIDSLPNFKKEIIQMPVFDQFPKIMDRLELFKSSIPKQDSFDCRINDSIRQHFNQSISEVINRLSEVQSRTKSIQTDLIELIALYKDLI